MERSNLDKFLFWLTIASATGLVLSFLLIDFLPDLILGLSVIGILVRADAMILKTKLPIYLKIIIPMIILSLLYILMLSDIGDAIFFIGGTAINIVTPVIIIHIPLIIAFAHARNELKETIKQLLIIIFLFAIAVYLTNFFSYHLFTLRFF